MRKNIARFYSILIIIALWTLQPCEASSFFEMTLDRNSIYTPGKMSLSLELTDKAKIEGEYRFQVSVYVTDTLMRKQIFPITKAEPVAFNLTFPEVNDKTVVRCRAELFINGEFIEAKEKHLVLWPPLTPYVEKLKNKVIWIFDISGQLQKIFDELEVEITDATFQAARNFQKPDIVFVGQNLDRDSIQVISNRLASVDNKPVVIFLKQKQLPKDSSVEISKENNRSINVACDLNSPLLEGLNRLDVMEMVDNANHVKVKRQKDKGWTINSPVTELIKDDKNLYSYLLRLEKGGQVSFYCQLPVTDGDDPRCRILLENLLKFANTIVDSREKLSKPL